jgi:hypothetical protein
MNWFSLLPTNKYAFIGFGLMMLGFFTLPIMIGLIIMPVGILFFVFGIHKAYFDVGKKFYKFYQKIKIGKVIGKK